MKTSKRITLFSLLLSVLLGFSVLGIAFAEDATPVATEEVAFDIELVLVDYIQTLPEGFYGIKPEAALKELSGAEKPFLIDVRDVKDVADGGYIAGAVLIPIRTLTQNLDKLPAQDQPILVYCGIGHRGGIATEVLHLLGYTNVRSISGGFAAWKTASLPVTAGMPAAPVVSDAAEPEFAAEMFAVVDEFLMTMPDDFYATAPAAALKSLSSDEKPFLIDVRGEQELIDNGYIEGQVNIPLKTLLDDMTLLPADKDQPIVVYCAIGHRGAMALTTLRLLGYTSVTSIGGGFNNWVKNSLPIVQES